MLVRSRCTAPANRRGFFSWFKAPKVLNTAGNISDPVPTVENRFYPWDQLPVEELRMRAATIKASLLCPVTKLPIQYTCPELGIPTHHLREAWELDTEYHELGRAQKLRWVNVCEHDLKLGREFPEFDFPQQYDPDFQVNLNLWDAFFITRQFEHVDSDFLQACVTKMLSYPATMAALLHQFLPYLGQPKGPVSREGLKLLAALRYLLYPERRQLTWKDRPMRLFILGARAEAQLPPAIWQQFAMLFPKTKFAIHFIGPELYYDRQRRVYVNLEGQQKVTRISPQIQLHFHTDFFHTLHEQTDFFPYDPYLDVFFAFHPGFASPECSALWERTVPALLELKCAVFVLCYNQPDLDQDYKLITTKYEEDMDVLMEPVPNHFGSTKWEMDYLNPHEVYQFNQNVFAFRGKRYHAIPK